MARNEAEIQKYVQGSDKYLDQLIDDAEEELVRFVQEINKQIVFPTSSEINPEFTFELKDNFFNETLLINIVISLVRQAADIHARRASEVVSRQLLSNTSNPEISESIFLIAKRILPDFVLTTVVMLATEAAREHVHDLDIPSDYLKKKKIVTGHGKSKAK